MLSKDEYESEIFDHDFQKNQILLGLEITKKFIINNKLILTGGMAIDFSLRLAKSKLYPDNKLPDYDFYSSNFHTDAYNLGEQLAKAGLENISVIRALHVSTMRVRVNFVPVADITYVPESIFKKIPTLTYQGFRFVHPNYQMIDQHRALSLPFENPPFETIMDRWSKDIKRYDLLYEHYPIEKLLKKKIKINYKKVSIDINLLDNKCLAGYAAISYYKDLKNKSQIKNNKLVIEIPKIKNNKLVIEIHDKSLITLLDCNYDESKYEDYTKYNALLDKIPNRVENKEYEIINSKNKLFSAVKHPEGNFYIANLQFCMCYALTKYLMYNDEIGIHQYLLARELLLSGVNNPSVEVYGDNNEGESTILLKKEFDDKILGVKSSISELVPKNAYPKIDKDIDKKLYDFVPSKSELYQFDGEIVNVS